MNNPINDSLISILTGDGIQLKRVSLSGGGEWAGACPFCGGRDRFRAWEHSQRYWCRTCRKNGDAIQYLRDVKRMSYQKACSTLGIDTGISTHLSSENRTKRNGSFIPLDRPAPCEKWTQVANQCLTLAQSNLWGDTGKAPLSYLLSRGLSETSIREFRLGYWPHNYFSSRTKWGLPDSFNDQGQLKKIWIPAGIVIPTFDTNHRLIRMRIRRNKSDDRFGRYIVISGGSSSPMILGRGPAIFILESELDAMLLHQETGGLVTAVAMGNAQIRPDAGTFSLLTGKKIAVALDYDNTGAREAIRFWEQTFSGAEYYPVPGGKDIGEAYQAGVNLRAWVMGFTLDDPGGVEGDLAPTADSSATMQKSERTCANCKASGHWDYSTYAGKLLCFKRALFFGRSGKPSICTKTCEEWRSRKAVK